MRKTLIPFLIAATALLLAACNTTPTREPDQITRFVDSQLPVTGTTEECRDVQRGKRAFLMVGTLEENLQRVLPAAEYVPGTAARSLEPGLLLLTGAYNKPRTSVEINTARVLVFAIAFEYVWLWAEAEHGEIRKPESDLEKTRFVVNFILERTVEAATLRGKVAGLTC